MAFNITIVAFDKEPDLSEEKILEYRGFDDELVGKTTQGTLHCYEVNTGVEGAFIRHVQVRDELVDSPNMILVIEGAVPEGAVSKEDIPPGHSQRIQDVFEETMLRLGCPDRHDREGPWFLSGAMAVCFLNVRKQLDADLVKGARWRMIKANLGKSE